MATGDDPLRLKQAQKRAREEAERIAHEAELDQQARRQAVPSSLAYALQAHESGAVLLRVGNFVTSVVLGAGRATARPEDVWAAIQRLVNEG